MNVSHQTLGVQADIQVTQETTEAFADAWAEANVDPKTTKQRKFFRLMLETMVEAGMVEITTPTTPMSTWDPNQVEWLATKANQLYTEKTTVPPE